MFQINQTSIVGTKRKGTSWFISNYLHIEITPSTTVKVNWVGNQNRFIRTHDIKNESTSTFKKFEFHFINDIYNFKEYSNDCTPINIQ